ncbi:hypothetical protein A9Q81_16650 [Gammaproteobacteria bacterium 42_54_T18]|nr:hypothetical protein A9Q81_16650 [Gammaproteobacteria bacterium 42_54_T18]
MENAVVIGFGSISKRHCSNLKLLYPDIKVYGMSSSGRLPIPLPDNTDEILTSIEDIIALNPNFVIVASPASHHKEHATRIINSGIPVLLEKPLAANLADAKSLVNCAKQSRTAVAVGYCLRYLSSSIKMKQLIDEHVLGKIYNININIGQFLPDWRPDKDYKDSVSANKSLGGGVLRELSHDIDYAQWLFGPLNFEFSILRTSQELELNVEDLADISLTTNSNAVCYIHMDFLQKYASRNCTIIGEKGRLDWDLIKNTIQFYGTANAEVLFDESDWDKNNMYLDMLIDFIKKIKLLDNRSIQVEEAYNVISLIEDIEQNGKWIK